MIEVQSLQVYHGGGGFQISNIFDQQKTTKSKTESVGLVPVFFLDGC